MKRKIIKTTKLEDNYILEVEVGNNRIINFETYIKISENHSFRKGLIFTNDDVIFSDYSKLGQYIYNTFFKKIGASITFDKLLNRAYRDNIRGFEETKPKNLVKHYNIKSHECLELRNIYVCYGDEFLNDGSKDVYMSINLSTEVFDYDDVAIEIYDLHKSLEAYIKETTNVDIDLVYSFDDIENIKIKFINDLKDQKIFIKSKKFNKIISQNLDEFNYYIITKNDDPCNRSIDIYNAKLDIVKDDYNSWDRAMHYRIVLRAKNKIDFINKYYSTDYIYDPSADMIFIKNLTFNDLEICESYAEALIKKASKTNLTSNEINNLKQVLLPKRTELNEIINKEI